MFAIIAAVVFVFAAFGAHLGSVNLVWIALAFLCLHFAYAWQPWTRIQRRP
jgi:hypothetical protein